MKIFIQSTINLSRIYPLHVVAFCLKAWRITSKVAHRHLTIKRYAMFVCELLIITIYSVFIHSLSR